MQRQFDYVAHHANHVSDQFLVAGVSVQYVTAGRCDGIKAIKVRHITEDINYGSACIWCACEGFDKPAVEQVFGNRHIPVFASLLAPGQHAQVEV
ncbi:hypothetical protein [Escherichia phage ZCEC12]|uniref:hypothetical protein n=1 Tax=Escherichia phage ZCEC10 TaxID=2894588 RepID=UPI00240D1108|nr:hypothetical protein P9622_gp16 [Escherichia phage ZCEC10]UJQ87906.1 hypothetical protein [Escherichia phage ZCEC11]UJQ87948.1 hypothetical protein [Escherichia phage ZCEC12]UJQ88045.1 hypothetical protein [Escherichia phage ZCEC10]